MRGLSALGLKGLLFTISFSLPTRSQTTSYQPIPTVPADAQNGANLLPNIYDPKAVNPQHVCPGYTGSDVTATANGLTATLSLAGKPCNVYGIDIQTLSLTVEYQSDDRLHIEIVPAKIPSSQKSWYILPASRVAKPGNEGSGSHNPLKFTWSNVPSFSFTVTRKSSGEVLFSTSGTKLVFENQFIEFISHLPEDYNLYGLGETIHGLRLGNNFTKTIYAADVGDPIDYNLYGSHPFYLDTRYHGSTSSSHGVYLRNAHGQEILLREKSITWRTIGGSIDLYIFPGPSQPSVSKSYLNVIGLPAMQQYWAFGYHQCRWGYSNWSVVEGVVDDYKKFDIPLETIWTDIDYMNQYRDFDNDPVRFNYADGKTFLDKLHSNGQHYIPIVDSAVYVPNPANASDAYPPFNAGNDTGSFLLNPDGSLYIGDVWPGFTVFPDWLTDAAGTWWTEQMKVWHGKVGWDGIWIDMSEVSSFCVGSCGTGNITQNPVHPPFSLNGEPGHVVYDYPESFNITNATEASSAAAASASQSLSVNGASSTATTTTVYLRTTPTPSRNINHPPYVINHVQGDLAVHAVSPNATHHDGTQEYDWHNLFGHEILVATYKAVAAVFPGKRPLVIGRSTFPGSGTVAGHWGGDNASLWAYMFFSIPQALSFSLFGIPMFGVDTCGFNGNTDEELCSRWMQLSAFFPFYRNHNTLNTISQEAYRWASVIDSTKSAMGIRFNLLPYMYTLFHLAHTTGSTVMRALAWEFPNDPALAAADRQFMLGSAILVTPVLEPQVNTVKGVFPGLGHGVVWYDWYSQAAVPVSGGGEYSPNVTISAPLGHIPVYVRGGNILPMQGQALVTRDARNTPWTVLVALCSDGTATGSLYLDDGESISPSETLLVSLNSRSNKLSVTVKGGYKDANPLSSVTILGVKKAPTMFRLNGREMGRGEFSVKSGSVTLSGLAGDTKEGAWAADWVLEWD